MIYAAISYASLSKDLPAIKLLPYMLDPENGVLLQSTHIYDRSGEHLLAALENPGVGARQYLNLNSLGEHGLPKTLVDATISYIDPAFWSHPGFTVGGVITGKSSTLAQALVSSLLLEDEPPGIRRNIRERLLAAQVTATYGKEQVLEWYLNSLKYGHLVYGADAASRAYFNKPASELSFSEAAFLVALSQAPELDPYEAFQIHLERQNQVIHAMLAGGMIDARQAEIALEVPVVLRPRVVDREQPATTFTSLVTEYLIQEIGRERLERGGVIVRTTLDYDLQTQANCAILELLNRQKGIQSGSSPTTESECQASRLLPTTVLHQIENDSHYSSNIIILDPRTGQVLALVGSAIEEARTPSLLPHPMGSLLTPIIYLTGFSRGMSPATLVWDIPDSLPTQIQEKIASKEQFHGPVSIRTALANDYLTPAIQILSQVGPENVWQIAGQLGMPSIELQNLQGMLQSYPLLSEGEVTLLEVSQAFSVIANRGVQVGIIPLSKLPNSISLIPITVLEVTDLGGNILNNCTEEQPVNCALQHKPVLSPELAYLITDVLSDETARWPSLGHPNPLEIGRPAGAKIGLVKGLDSAWTIGFTPQLVVGVWTGAAAERNPQLVETPQPAGSNEADIGEIPVKISSALWHAILQYATRSLTPEGWTIPDGVRSVDVCYPSGLLPTFDCPTIVNDIFLQGYEPSHLDNLYRTIQINRETGRLATIFTPPELIDERIYLVPPSFAQPWAQTAGLPVPPDAYDEILPNNDQSQSIHITSPAMFDYVRGKVSIKGSAGGDGFSFFRIQVGNGLNPQELIQIGEDETHPIDEGTLVEWDTSGLSGLYAIQLLVVRRDQHIDTATIQVTVDNTPPTIQIVEPEMKKQYSITPGLALPLTVTVNDDIALARIEYSVDGNLLAVLQQPPYTLAWKPKDGEHTFQAKAYDYAGNTNQASVQFFILQK
jgi:membrane peptidoglycan carboxypeptidase